MNSTSLATAILTLLVVTASEQTYPSVAVSGQRPAISDAAAVEAPPTPASQTNPATSATRPAKPTETQTAARFAAVHLYIDPQGTPLAAYQIELLADSALVRIVGIEGGQHPAFSAPPYYDPAAMMNHRVIIAAFNTGRDLPSTRTRMATIHVQVTGHGKPTYHARLHTAGDPEGKRISPAVSVEEQETSTPGSGPAGES